jgi:ATP-dependent protease ClpP protease subunit
MKFENNVEEGTITFRGGVGEFEGYISADMFIDALNEHSGDVTIHLDSTGGSVTDGLAIHNAILAHDGIVNIHIDTMCASIATVIACSATGKVIMNSNGKYMIHRAWTAAMGNCKDFRSMADIMELMDAEKALELGLIDEIKDVRAAKKKKKKDYTNEEKPEIKAHLPIGQIMAKISATLLEYENK